VRREPKQARPRVRSLTESRQASTLYCLPLRARKENAVVKMRNVYPFALACLMIAIAWKLFVECVLWVGFPDGFIAELDGAEKVLATWFIWFCLVMSVWFAFLGARSFRFDIKRKLAFSCILFVVVATAALTLDQYFRSYMMDSRGG
jgi:hypothetical protein